ncbi:phage tail protein [Pseudomonas sp. RT6P73]
MIDANSQFFAILTNVGMAKQANADALGIPWKITEMGLGDANNTDPIPNASQTKLINEWRRRPLNQLKIDPVNPAVIIAEQVIPADEGGRWIREIALYDADGDMVAVANCAPSFKPILSQGSGRTQIVRMNFIVTNSGNITLKIDPSIVLATRSYVDTAIISVLPPNKTAGTFTKVTINERGVVQSGSNPTTLAGYGITDGFATTIAGSDYNGLTKSGLYNFPASNTPNLPLGFSGSGAFHHAISDYGFTLSYDLASDSVAFRRALPGAYGSWRNLWHSGNFTPGSKADKATTLAGYGVASATQEDVDVETNFDNTRAMTMLRVVQAIEKFVKPATAVLAGVVRRSTQPEVDAGTEDTSYVTPKKMRWGFQFLKATNGYIIFPTFLGGWIVQWGVAPITASSTAVYALPIPFPNNYFVGVCQSTTLGMTTNYTTGFGMRPIGRDKIEFQNNYNGSAISLGFITIGN